jgi:hypothetical protein
MNPRSGVLRKRVLRSLVGEQSTFPIYEHTARTRTEHGVKGRRARVYGSEIAGNLQVYELFHNGCKV